MPWGWECRAKMVKQMPAKPTLRQGQVCQEIPTPSPADYELPDIFCGPGFSKIKRSPAYTFGHMTPATFQKSAAKPTAPLFNVQKILRTGPSKLKHGVISPHLEPVANKTKVPGPATYNPPVKISYKRVPAYTIRQAARPPYQPWDMWTPPPNMYWPPMFGKKAPAYSLGNIARSLKAPDFPGPGEHEPKFNYVKKNKPAFSFGAPFRRLREPRYPAPNTYCEKKFMIAKPTIPAPSFGIRHTPYRGEKDVYLRPERLDYLTSSPND